MIMARITAEQVEQVLALIEDGESENAACKQVGVNRATFRSAVLRYNVADTYARATEALARDQVEKLEQAIQEARNGEVTPEIARLEIDARKWIASKLFKPSWGDKMAVEQSGSVQHNHAIDTSNLTDDQLRVLASIGAGK